MSLTNDEVLKILKLLDESEYDDVRVEVGDVKLHLQRHGGSEVVLHPITTERTVDNKKATTPPVAAAVVMVPDGKAGDTPIPEGLAAIRAPMLGTFYRSPSPGEKPYVEVGAKVNPDDTVCLVEVMKLFNSVKAGMAGTVVSILAENSAMVEFGQALILIKPDQA